MIHDAPGALQRRISLTLPRLAAALLLGATCVAQAGTFSVSPVRIFMQARDRATAVTILNEGTTELVMQADVFAWSQGEDGTDKLVPTDDVVLAPPILKIAPGGKQVVRLANLRPPPMDAQQTYRLIVREVPEALPQSTGVNVQVALAFSLPVFITPTTAKPKLACDIKRAAANRAMVTCDNSGQAYVQPVSLSLQAPDGQPIATQEVRGGYILPAARKSFDIASSSPALRSGGMKLEVVLDDGSKQAFDVRLPD